MQRLSGKLYASTAPQGEVACNKISAVLAAGTALKVHGIAKIGIDFLIKAALQYIK